MSSPAATSDAPLNTSQVSPGQITSLIQDASQPYKPVDSFDFPAFKSRIHKSYKQTQISRNMRKYYNRRYMLFSKFDSGILMDNESWFSVTPEKTAQYHAHEIFSCLGSRPDLTILDAFCGSGGNTIHFSKHFSNVISCDIDFLKLQCAQNNAQIYATGNSNINFVVQDFFSLHKTLREDQKIDVIFLSPPWGGVKYFHSRQADLSEFPLDCFKIYLYCINELKCRNIVMYLPRNANLEQVMMMAGPGGKCRIEQNFIDHKLVALTVYYGDLCRDSDFVVDNEIIQTS